METARNLCQWKSLALWIIWIANRFLKELIIHSWNGYLPITHVFHLTLYIQDSEVNGGVIAHMYFAYVLVFAPSFIKLCSSHMTSYACCNINAVPTNNVRFYTILSCLGWKALQKMVTLFTIYLITSLLTTALTIQYGLMTPAIG